MKRPSLPPSPLLLRPQFLLVRMAAQLQWLIGFADANPNLAAIYFARNHLANSQKIHLSAEFFHLILARHVDVRKVGGSWSEAEVEHPAEGLGWWGFQAP